MEICLSRCQCSKQITKEYLSHLFFPFFFCKIYFHTNFEKGQTSDSLIQFLPYIKHTIWSIPILFFPIGPWTPICLTFSRMCCFMNPFFPKKWTLYCLSYSWENKIRFILMPRRCSTSIIKVLTHDFL